MEIIRFASQSPSASGSFSSEEERERDIEKFLQSVQWVHPGVLVSDQYKNPNIVEAVLILRRSSSCGRSWLSFWENLASCFSGFFGSRFDDQKSCIDGRHEWNAYKIRRKMLLVLHDAVKDAQVVKKQGFDVQVILPRAERLHRLKLPDPNGLISPTPEPFEDFLRTQSFLARYSLSR